MHDWMLRYSTEQHGCSLRTAMAKVAERGGSLLVVRDVHGHVFGGFASTPWHVSPHYFGTGECFVFSAGPSFRCWPWTGARLPAWLARHLIISKHILCKHLLYTTIPTVPSACNTIPTVPETLTVLTQPTHRAMDWQRQPIRLLRYDEQRL